MVELETLMGAQGRSWTWGSGGAEVWGRLPGLGPHRRHWRIKGESFSIHWLLA